MSTSRKFAASNMLRMMVALVLSFFERLHVSPWTGLMALAVSVMIALPGTSNRCVLYRHLRLVAIVVLLSKCRLS